MTSFTLNAVCIGQPTALRVGKRDDISGIDKHPVPGRVTVGLGGLDGDHVNNKKHHGGPDQAAYLYTAPDYDHWTAVLGEALRPGTLGENLLLSGLESAALRVGDRLTVHGPDGEVVFEVTAPRIPCATLAAHMGDGTFAKRFAQARRPGAYLRVLQPGTVGADDRVTFTPAEEGAPTIAELFDLWFGAKPDAATLEGYLRWPLAVRLRRDVEEELSKASR
ncbi:MOSC domain-containing protein [Deinococcus radiotolerans]|uniref:Molybdenum cofactor biosysynthesis protein n=1 Tax=Deinococcus radiotolerans TaxID=1309407 RepID=A0ABQ2FEZ8_9DEIO|nr:MOSC domain-containing protein [Deinococcus radiotolerans]GGK87893.1 molybdenum cofactor biosysynthesis protein [Deinococcus radiotolerans]